MRHYNVFKKKCNFNTFDKVKRQRLRTRNSDKEDSLGMVVLPYVKGVTEECQRILKSYNISSAAKPIKTLRNCLVHPKDKRNTMDTTGVVFKVPCASCNVVYVGETGRKLSTRISEHQKDFENESTRPFTRSQRRTSESTYHKSAITDHATQNNHIIDWKNTSVLDNDNNRFSRWIRESIYIRKAGGSCMNRDCGQYQLDHSYTPLLRRNTTRAPIHRPRDATHDVTHL